MSGSISSVEGDLNAIVKEFLDYSKLEQTLVAFEEECMKMGKPIQEQAGKNRKDERKNKIKSALLEHFDNGQRTEFFSEWETHVDAVLRGNSNFCQKLEFNLQIHFAVLPMRKVDHWSKEEVEEAMLHFHYFLESKGSALSDCAEFLPFYALPYVSRPDTHPSFQELFQYNEAQLYNQLAYFQYIFDWRKAENGLSEEEKIHLKKSSEDEDFYDFMKASADKFLRKSGYGIVDLACLFEGLSVP